MDEILPRLYERDVDVLVQEELLFNREVFRLFIEALGLNEETQVSGCRLSVVDERGETDILVSIEFGSKRGLLQIENKIDAAFQPTQPERHRERSIAAIAEGQYDEAFCALIAPKSYFYREREEFKYFDTVISYEDIANAMAKASGPRSQYRASLLLRAIEQARSAYKMIPVPEITRFWNRVYEIAQQQYPVLKMSLPGEKGQNSAWMIFKADLPSRITIDWKVRKNTVELSFWPGVPIPSIKEADLVSLNEIARGKVLKSVSGKTTLVRVPISPVPENFIDMSDDQIEEALRAAAALVSFYRGIQKPS